jgi:hypothetical protein
MRAPFVIGAQQLLRHAYRQHQDICSELFLQSFGAITEKKFDVESDEHTSSPPRSSNLHGHVKRGKYLFNFADMSRSSTREKLRALWGKDDSI